MKKLMTMIAAVATAFGLFAEDAVTYDGTSFETQAEGVTENTWAPPDGGVWTTDITDAFDLGAYDNDKYDYGTHARRDAKFENGEGNVKYLKLETGSETLNRTIDGTDKIYFDQVVKFTGFEEPQTFTGEEKIAVWMSNYEDDDTTVDVDEAETALYVAVGTADPTAPIKSVKLNKTVAVDTWYRVTIKSLGAVDENRAGFRVWIDGEEVGIVEADKNYYQGQLTDAAKKFDDAGKLFVAMDDTSATLAKVSYKGLGSIDDVIVSQDAPDFDAEVAFNFTAPDGAILSAAYLIDGQTETPLDLNNLKAMPNSMVKAVFTAAAGYRLDKDTWQDTIGEGGPIDVSDTIEVVEGYATLNGAVKGEDELTDMMAGLKDGDKVVFLQQASIYDDEGVQIYDFTEGTEIDVTVADDVTTWAVTVAGDDAWVADYVGAAADVIKVYTFAGEGSNLLALEGDVAGAITAPALEAQSAIEVSGVLKAASLTIDDTITLVGAGKVMAQDNTLIESFEADEGEVVVSEEPDEDGYYTYTIDTADYVAQIGTKKYATLNEAFAEAKTGDTIEMLAGVTLSERIFIGSEEGDKAITLDLAGKAITWDATVANASGMFIVRSGSTLTINDSSDPDAGKIDANGKAQAAIAVTHGTYQDNNKTASLYVNGGTLIGYYQGIAGNGTRPNTYIEVNGGTITATAPDTNQAIYNPQGNSTVVINDGTLIGLDSAVEMRGGTLTVTGGTLTALAEEFSSDPNGSGSTTKGAAVAVAQHTTEMPISATISGGTLNGLYAVSVTNPQKSPEANVAVTLGAATYNGDLFFSADENATVTNNGADLDAPAGYKWDTDGKLVAKYHGNYTIANVADLKDLQADVAAGQTFEGVTFTQTADIDMAGEVWAGIGRNSSQEEGDVLSFEGTYDGQGYTIENVTFEGGHKYGGFFNCVINGTIKNLTIDVDGFTASDSKTGYAAIVGRVDDATIQACVATGTLAPAGKTHSMAGLCVSALNSEFIDCTNKAAVVGNYDKAGGLVAIHNWGSGTLSFVRCSNEGSVTCPAASNGVGGFVGYIGSSFSMEDCVSKGAVSTDTGVAGSIVGFNSGIDSSVKVTLTGTNKVIDGMVTVGKFNADETGYKFDTDYGVVGDDGLVTLVKEADFAMGDTYKVMIPKRAPAFAFAEAGTIAFDEAIVAAKNFEGITAGDESLDVTSDKQGSVTTFTAALKEFTVTYKVEGVADTTETVVWGESPKAVPTPAEKTGYTGAWDKNPATAVIKADETFTYTYTAKTDCKVTFDTDGGTAFEDQTYTFNTPFNLNEYTGTKTDFEFGGWTNTVAGGAVIANGAQLAADVESYSLKAVWIASKPAYPSYIPTDDPVAQGKWDEWSKGKSLDNVEADIVKDAFLLNCDLNEVDAKKAAFKITSISQDAEGNWVVEVDGKVHKDEFGNGFIKIVPYVIDGAGDDAAFFKAELVIQQPAE